MHHMANDMPPKTKNTVNSNLNCLVSPRHGLCLSKLWDTCEQLFWRDNSFPFWPYRKQADCVRRCFRTTLSTYPRSNRETYQTLQHIDIHWWRWTAAILKMDGEMIVGVVHEIVRKAPSVQAVRLAIMETIDQVRGCCYELCRIITGGGNTGNSIKFGSSPLPGLPSSDGVWLWFISGGDDDARISIIPKSVEEDVAVVLEDVLG